MFIIALILFGIALLAIVAALMSDDPAPVFGVAFAVAVLGFIFIVISCMSIVPTRNVGIVTAWNKPTGRTTGAGLQWTKPWENVDDWDASGQTYAHLGDDCVWVTIAAQRRACIPVQIEWSTDAARAPQNWAAYKQVGSDSRFDTWVNRRVNPQINAALTSVFASFDPLGNASAAQGESAAPDLNATFRDPLKKALVSALGDDIAVHSIAFESPRYDQPTTNAIAAFGQKVLEARNLQIDKANALTRKAITDIDASVSQTARCLSIAEELGKEPGLCLTGATPVRNVG